MSHSNPINLSSSSSSDSFWDDFVLNNPGRVEKEEYEEVVSRKRKHSSVLSNPFSVGPSSLQPVPQDALIKGDTSKISSNVSPYEDTDDETSGRVLSVPPLTAIVPHEELQPSPSLPFLTAPPLVGPSSSSPPVGVVVMGLASPKVYSVIDRRNAPKFMPEWAFPKKP